MSDDFAKKNTVAQQNELARVLLWGFHEPPMAHVPNPLGGLVCAKSLPNPLRRG